MEKNVFRDALDPPVFKFYNSGDKSKVLYSSIGLSYAGNSKNYFYSPGGPIKPLGVFWLVLRQK